MVYFVQHVVHKPKFSAIFKAIIQTVATQIFGIFVWKIHYHNKFIFYRSTNCFKQYFSVTGGFLCISSKVTSSYRKRHCCSSQNYQTYLIITHEESEELSSTFKTLFLHFRTNECVLWHFVHLIMNLKQIRYQNISYLNLPHCLLLKKHFLLIFPTGHKGSIESDSHKVLSTK